LKVLRQRPLSLARIEWLGAKKGKKDHEGARFAVWSALKAKIGLQRLRLYSDATENRR